jgi:hypothetical protein
VGDLTFPIMVERSTTGWEESPPDGTPHGQTGWSALSVAPDGRVSLPCQGEGRGFESRRPLGCRPPGETARQRRTARICFASADSLPFQLPVRAIPDCLHPRCAWSSAAEIGRLGKGSCWPRACHVFSFGTLKPNAMILMITAITPSLKASSRAASAPVLRLRDAHAVCPLPRAPQRSSWALRGAMVAASFFTAGGLDLPAAARVAATPPFRCTGCGATALAPARR